MFCEKCGTQIADTENFCPNCGAQQSVADASAPAYGAPAAPAASTFKLYDILVFVAIAIMAIGTLLPLITVSFLGQSGSINYLGIGSGVFKDAPIDMGDGIFVIIAAVAAAALYLFNKEKLMVIPAAVTAILLIMVMSKMADAGLGDMVKYGLGYWVMWIGAIGTAVLPFTPLAAERGFYLKR